MCLLSWHGFLEKTQVRETLMQLRELRSTHKHRQKREGETRKTQGKTGVTARAVTQSMKIWFKTCLFYELHYKEHAASCVIFMSVSSFLCGNAVIT